MQLLELRNIGKSFVGNQVLKKVNLEIEEGEIIGLIGPNGSGKSTLLNIINGLHKPDTGIIKFQGIRIDKLALFEISRLGIVRTFQDSKNLLNLTANENLTLSFRDFDRINFLDTIFNYKKYKSITNSKSTLANEILDKVGFKKRKNIKAHNLSYGQSKFLELAKLESTNPKLVLLDEPFSGLFPEAIKEMSQIIVNYARQGNTVILVEHNMKLIEQVCTRVIALDAGEVIAQGTFSEVSKNKKVINTYLGN